MTGPDLVETGGLKDWGWDPSWAAAFDAFAGSNGDCRWAARVVAQHRGAWLLAAELGERSASLTGRFRHEARDGQLPAVGDWVALRAVAARRRGPYRRRTAPSLRVHAAGGWVARGSPDRGRQRRHAVRGNLSQRRPQPAPPRTVRGDGSRIRRRAGRAPDQGGPRPGRRRARGPPRCRIAGGRRALSAQVRRRASTSIATWFAPGRTLRSCRVVGRRQVDAPQPSRRRAVDGHARDPRRRRPWPPYDDPPRAVPASGRGADARHARHA